MASQGSSNGGPTTRSSAQVTIMRELNRFFLSGVKMTGRPSLGVGAYGSVEPLELNGMLCAGKQIHDILVDVGNEGADDMAVRFVEECKLMSELRHPNVVQFLGLCLSPSSPLPILVMEHLYCSLDDLLETSPDIPLYMKRSILRDVALGLAHLHGRHPAIIHRDLTARNVLLNNNMQAKVADFGVARILNLPVGKLEATLSRVPGTSTYMPPEVFNREAKYNTAVDIFSFGHLVLFTITQKQPGVEAATYVDSSGRIIARSEIERRESSVAQLYGILGREHPFVDIVTGCLQTNALLRPSILQVLAQLEEVKSSVRDPYSRQTRLTLTRMIRKKAAENKRITAELQRVQEDLLNAKRRIVDLTEQMRYYQAGEGQSRSPTSGMDTSKHNYYNSAVFKGDGEIHDDYESIRDAADSVFSNATRTLSSPTLASHSTRLSSPPPVPSVPRPTCISPEQPSSGSYSHVNSSSQPSDSQQPLFLSLPRAMNTRHLSHENLHAAPDYVKVKDVVQRQHSDTPKEFSGHARASPFLSQGFRSDSESDSDFDEFEPHLLRKSPHFPPTSNLYNTHPSAATNTQYPTYLTNAPSSTYSSHYAGPTSLSSGPTSLSAGPTSLSTGPMSLSTGPTSLSSTSSHSSTLYETIPRLPGKPPETVDTATSLQPLTIGMAGKLHFYTDLDPNMLLLLQNTDSGKIPGVRYDETETGQVQIETDSTDKTKLASERFRSAYIHAMREHISEMVDIPGDVTESTVEEIISAHSPHFSKSTVSYNGLESSLQIISFSGGELVQLKRALEEAIQRAKQSHDHFSTTGHITVKTRLSIKKGNLGFEDTDVIVLPNTSNLACKDGVAKAVDDASHGAISKQCKAFITKHGLLGFGETIIMKGGGSLKAKYVIHVNPGIGSCINLQDVLRKLVTQALKLASGKNASSISFCPLVPTWSEANIGMIAQTMVRSMKVFASDKKGRKMRIIRIIVQEQIVFDCFSEHAKLS